ncbi:mechanosensitive ion channel family protein [Acetobacter sp. AN02]|uniref:mechanosensitive ion channel family protein n=1 Tax=Acetobacter sp. AN02 TaxID=2894186 RepID=UPI0024342441|nr:mechanosensitive ion channel family protein [Acetobacter sp. AN02]MDG6095583.1 mechanosensitive ion channel family protein [Acetobacter sp. AN02]
MAEHWYRSTLTELSTTIAWLPPSVASTIILIVVAFIALVSGGAITGILPLLPGLRRIPLIRDVAFSLKNHVRVLMMLLALIAALPVMQGYSDATLYTLSRSFACLFILTLGFGLIRAFRLGVNKYRDRITRLKGTEDISARSHQTQIRVLHRLGEFTFGVIVVATALMMFPAVRQYGVSLFASAGAASLVIGLSARTVFSNLIAGIQIAFTQPIRIEDMLILNGDWAWVEEINATYVVLRTWDRRRYIVPISWFLENPFQNWTHSAPSLVGTVMLALDYHADISAVRRIFDEEIEKCPGWDGDRGNTACQVTDINTHSINIRMIAATVNAGMMWNMCCALRERMLTRLRAEMPECLPRGRTALVSAEPGEAPWPDRLISPPVNRPETGPWTGPDITRKSA